MNDLAQWTANITKKTFFWGKFASWGSRFLMQQVSKPGGVSANIPDFLKLIDRLLSSTAITVPAGSWVGVSARLGISHHPDVGSRCWQLISLWQRDPGNASRDKRLLWQDSSFYRSNWTADGPRQITFLYFCMYTRGAGAERDQFWHGGVGLAQTKGLFGHHLCCRWCV